MELQEYRKKVANLDVNEQKLRDLYVRDISLGKILGPVTGYASLDKPWLKYYSEESIRQEIPPMSLLGYLKYRNLNPQDIALDYFHVKITYKQLFKRIEEVKSAFLEMGINDKSNITLCLPNTPEFVYIIYALNDLGANVQFIDPRINGESIKSLIDRGKSDLYITFDDSYIANRDYIQKSIAKKIIEVSPFDSLPLGLKQLMKFKNKKENIKSDKTLMTWTDFLKLRSSKKTSLSSTEGKLIINTGGTTGNPKGVILSSNAINYVALQYANANFAFEEKDKIMFNIPNSLAYGLVISLHLPLSVGMHLQVVPTFNPEKYEELILKYKPNHIVGIPDWYQQMYMSQDMKKLPLEFIKTAASGGTPMSQTVKDETNLFLKQGGSKAFVIEGYGMTEVGSSAATNLRHLEIAHSVGAPLVKNIISIFDPDTLEELPYNTPGEVCISGPTKMDEYLDNPKETAKTMKTHNQRVWIHTGDIGRITPDGVLFIEGRTKRIIETYTTHKIYSESIEELIMTSSKVESCAVVSLPDLEHGKGYVAKAIFKLYDKYYDQTEEAIEEVKELCSKSLDKVYIPSEFEVIDKMPFTASGKINYKKLETEAREKQAEAKKLVK